MSEDNWGAGDKAKWGDDRTVMVGSKRYPLIWGEHPHSRQDNQHYVLMGDGEPTGFDGHRVLIDITFKSSNYLKSSVLSGDQVRKSGQCIILADAEAVFEFSYRDTKWALYNADHIIDQLWDSSSQWLMKREREQLVGRKVFYDRHPAIITSLIMDQGCMMLSTEDGRPFPLPIWAATDEDVERDSRIKVGVLSPHIWWFRK